MTPERRAFLVKAQARSLRFDAAGITHLEPLPHGDALREWLSAGYAGTMRYMQRQAARRLEPAAILPGATCAVVLAKHYLPPEPTVQHGAAGKVARYARGRDYHDALRPPLEALAAYVRSLGPADTAAKAYIDAGPVPERELAQRAGLGWIGKNTMLIQPQRGSYCFLATVLTTLNMAVDLPFEADRCGTCRRCMDACPTEAFAHERVLDSRRCISYLTIELRGDVPPALHSRMGDWVFGCDVCQEVCPWNHKFAKVTQDPVYEHDQALARLDVTAFESMDENAFAARYGKTAFARPGLTGMHRNARIVSRNITARSARKDDR